MQPHTSCHVKWTESKPSLWCSTWSWISQSMKSIQVWSNSFYLRPVCNAILFPANLFDNWRRDENLFSPHLYSNEARNCSPCVFSDTLPPPNRSRMNDVVSTFTNFINKSIPFATFRTRIQNILTSLESIRCLNC